MSRNDNVNVHISEEVVTKRFATILVNGVEKGKREINGEPSLSAFSKAVAAEFGIKAFTITVDGADVTSLSQAESPVREGSTVAVATKESRGSRNRHINSSEQVAPAPTEPLTT